MVVDHDKTTLLFDTVCQRCNAVLEFLIDKCLFVSSICMVTNNKTIRIFYYLYLLCATSEGMLVSNIFLYLVYWYRASTIDRWFVGSDARFLDGLCGAKHQILPPSPGGWTVGQR